jgi:hypothetical protein
VSVSVPASVLVFVSVSASVPVLYVFFAVYYS